MSSKFLVSSSSASLLLDAFDSLNQWSSLCDYSEVNLDPSTCAHCCLWHVETKFWPTLTTQFPKTFSDHVKWGVFFFQVVSGFGGPEKLICRERSLEDVKQVCVSSALLATAIFMDLTHCLSDSALSTALPGKITQNKPGASALSLCAGLSLPSHGHIPLLIQCSLPLPQSCVFLWPLLLVSLSSCFHFVFFVGPRKLKLCVFVDQTSAASYYHWLLKGRVRWWLRLSWISFQKWWWIIALWIPVPCKYFCCLIFYKQRNWVVFFVN